MAKKIVKEIVIDAKTKEAIANMDRLGQTFEQVFEGANSGIKPLTTQIGELEDAMYALAAAGQTNSQEFKDLQQKVGNYKSVIIETDLQIDAMAETTAQNLGGAVEGVAGAFAIGTGAMGAFGVESEAVEEMLLRVQSAMAITQGIQSVRTGIKAFKGLKAAIMANTVVQKVLNVVMSLNPIGLIIAAVAALLAGIMLLFNPIKDLMGFLFGTAEATENVAESNDKLNASYEKTIKSLDAVISKQKQRHDHSIKMLELEGASDEELHQAKIDRENELQSLNQIKLMGVKRSIKEGTRLYKEAIAQEDFELAKSIREENDARREQRDQLKILDDDYYNNKEALRQQEINRVKEENAANYKAYKQRVDQEKSDRLAASRAIEDAVLANKADTEAKEQEMNLLAFNRFKEDTLANTKLTEDEKLALIEASEESARQKRIEISQKYNAEFDALLATADAARKEKKAVELQEFEERAAEENRILKEKEEQAVADKEEAEQKKQALMAKSAEMASSGLNAIGDIANLIADGAIEKAEGNEAKQEKIRKKAFNANKAVQLSLAVVDGFKAITTSLAQSPIAIGPIPNPMGIASLAFAALTSAVNIAKIAATKYKSTAGKPTAPNANGALAAAPPPQFDVVGSSPENQLAQSLGQDTKPVQAFVVSGDVTTAQGLERNAIKTASL